MIRGVSDWVRVDPEELLGALADVQSAVNAVQARMLRLVAEVDARGLAGERGYKDTEDLLRSAQLVTRREAGIRVRAARDAVRRRSLTGEPLAAALPEVAAAVAKAEISLEHVAVIQETVAAVPADLQFAHAAVLERDLVDAARTLDPASVRTVGKRALAFLNPDGPRPRPGIPTRNRLRLTELGDGFQAQGWFDRDSAAILRTALSPLAAPAPEHGPGECEGRNCEHRPSEVRPDPRSSAERQADALVELCSRMLDSGALPVAGGSRPHVTVTIPLASLQDSGSGLLEFGDGPGRGALCAEESRRLACEAEIVPVVLGAAGEPLDVGRSTRIVNRAMRRALEFRDGGCSAPGCSAPAQWTEAHHVRHWAHGGPTALDNLCLLCRRHHRLVHKGEWRITMENGFPVFHPPPWTGRPPSRNHLHRPDLIGATPEPRVPVVAVF
jgi:hypothetical protein